jgi:hypothetical protein
MLHNIPGVVLDRMHERQLDPVVPRLVPGGILVADKRHHHRETLQPTSASTR